MGENYGIVARDLAEVPKISVKIALSGAVVATGAVLLPAFLFAVAASIDAPKPNIAKQFAVAVGVGSVLAMAAISHPRGAGGFARENVPLWLVRGLTR